MAKTWFDILKYTVPGKWMYEIMFCFYCHHNKLFMWYVLHKRYNNRLDRYKN